MNHRAEPPPDYASLIARMCALDPKLGGIILRRQGRARDAALAVITAAIPAGSRVRRLPVNVREDQLDGGIDLAAALAGLGAWRQPGLLEGGGLLIVPMADRLAPAVAARIAREVDDGLLVVALDDGEGEVPMALADRLAFRSGHDDDELSPSAGDVRPVTSALEVLAATATALGIVSVRADLLALRAARALAKIGGRAEPCEADLAEAARLVLAPRATRLPAASETAAAEAHVGQSSEADGGDGLREMTDRAVAAAQAAIDPELLAALTSGRGRHGAASRTRGPGERRRSRERGRPIGTRPGDPRNGARLSLIETLRAAAPWQRLRGRTDRVLVRASDLRVIRREARADTVVIFGVDASGSAAMARMGEAKGAVELLLGQAYVQRAEVALTAFRGTGAELLLPPTRSLTRARRALAELPGGGGTPLADGIQATLEVALASRAKGRTPTVVLLSDGRANIAAGGISAGRAAAERDAAAAARALRAAGVSALFVDIAARPRPEGPRVAEAMGARYLPLPFAGGGAMHAIAHAIAQPR